jgi:hypothetical protein
VVPSPWQSGDPITLASDNAEAAARKVIAGDAIATPKTTTGVLESIRMLTVARNSAVKARSIAMSQLQDILVTAPAALREQITVPGTRRKAALCRKFRPDMNRLSDPVQAAKLTLKSLAQRIEQLDAEVSAIDARPDTGLPRRHRYWPCRPIPHHRWRKHRPRPQRSLFRPVVRCSADPCVLWAQSPDAAASRR